MIAPVLAAAIASVTVLDDGEKISRDESHALPRSPWPSGDVELFALRGETVAVQVVVGAGDYPIRGVRVGVNGLEGIARETYVEEFVEVVQPSASPRDADGGSLAFTRAAAPRPPITGWIADALVPSKYARADAAPRERAAIWLDFTIDARANPGTYRGEIFVTDDARDSATLASRAISVRVIDREMPWAAAKTAVYYDPREIARRTGDARIEGELRDLFHAWHVSAIRDLHDPATPSIGLDRDALARGDGVAAIGAYGSLGDPSPSKLDVAERIARALGGQATISRSDVFVWSIDEDCASDRAARWLPLVTSSEILHGVRVGVTCDEDPMAQAADLVIEPSHAYYPSRARVARREGKDVWTYNGRRPFAGAMVLDVPATDLRANAWIAMRYGVSRWLYWESTFWFDDDEGGKGGDRGWDPFAVAETFHNAHGDRSNGDGILVYPGTQQRGMIDFGARAVFPSVRLANLRRGVEDAGYIELARRVDRARVDALVRRVVPRALAEAGSRPSWPERGAPWIEARRDLAAILESLPETPASVSSPSASPHTARASARVSDGCATSSGRSTPLSGVAWLAALFLMRTMIRKRAHLPQNSARSHALAPRLEDDVEERKRAQEAPTLPPPPLVEAVPPPRRQTSRPPKASVAPPTRPSSRAQGSGIRAKRSSVPVAATVDEVTADMKNDPRRED